MLYLTFKSLTIVIAKIYYCFLVYIDITLKVVRKIIYTLENSSKIEKIIIQVSGDITFCRTYSMLRRDKHELLNTSYKAVHIFHRISMYNRGSPTTTVPHNLTTHKAEWLMDCCKL